MYDRSFKSLVLVHDDGNVSFDKILPSCVRSLQSEEIAAAWLAIDDLLVFAKQKAADRNEQLGVASKPKEEPKRKINKDKLITKYKTQLASAREELEAHKEQTHDLFVQLDGKIDKLTSAIATLTASSSSSSTLLAKSS